MAVLHLQLHQHPRGLFVRAVLRRVANARQVRQLHGCRPVAMSRNTSLNAQRRYPSALLVASWRIFISLSFLFLRFCHVVLFLSSLDIGKDVEVAMATLPDTFWFSFYLSL